MRTPSSLPFWLKAAEAVALAVAICFSVGATSPNGRLYDLDHRLMCTCGCAEILGECNHVGCTQSTQELAELRQDIDSGMSDQQIFDGFVAKYGATVLAAPPAKGFDLIAWIATPVVFVAGLLATILLVRRWGGLRGGGLTGGKGHAQVSEEAILDPAERERRERIRRETSMDAGTDGGL